jgi:hypothetical protein
MMEWLYLGCFYIIPLALFVLSYQLWGLDMISWLPRVVAFWIALPLDKVLQLFSPPLMSVASDGLDLVLFFIVDKVRWGSREVFSVFFCFYVRGQKGGVEDRVDSPLRGEMELVYHWGDNSLDQKGSMSSWG